MNRLPFSKCDCRTYADAQSKLAAAFTDHQSLVTRLPAGGFLLLLLALLAQHGLA